MTLVLSIFKETLNLSRARNQGREIKVNSSAVHEEIESVDENLSSLSLIRNLSILSYLQ
jgi:hypothetical protein